jgi:c-di-GMP-binding flagellar brake protein YcgR
MIEKRKHPRIRFDAPCLLEYDGQSHDGRLVNISLGGAMVSLRESAMIPQDETCLIRIFSGEPGEADDIGAVVAYSAFSCIGLRFLDFSPVAHPHLYARVEELSRDPERYRVAYP